MMKCAIAGIVTFVGAACFAATCWWVLVHVGYEVTMPRWCTASLTLSVWAVVCGRTFMKEHSDE